MNIMDKLEEYITRHTDDLNRYSPQTKTWKKIRKEIRRDKSSRGHWIYTAAMIAVIFGISVILFRPVYRWSSHEKNNNGSKILSRANTQLKETEVYYNNLVSTLYSEITPLLSRSPEIRKELNADLSHIDSISVRLRNDLKDNISNEDVVEALIQNYRIKISILEDMLSVMKENEETPDKKKSYEL